MNTFQWERVAQEKLNVQKRVFFCFDSRHNMKYWSYLVEKLLQNIRIKCNHLQQFYPGWKDKAFPQPQRKIYLTWWWWLNKSLQISTMWLLFIMFHQKYKWNNQKRSTCFKRKKKHLGLHRNCLNIHYTCQWKQERKTHRSGLLLPLYILPLKQPFYETSIYVLLGPLLGYYFFLQTHRQPQKCQ